MDNNIIELIIRGKDEASKVIEGVGKELETTTQKAKDMSGTFKTAGAIITGVGIAGVAVMRDWVMAAANAQKEMVVANSIIGGLADTANTKGVASFKKLNEEMEKAGKTAVQFGFDDEEASVAFAKTLNITKDLTITQKLQTAAMDLARYSGKGLTETSLSLNMALQGNGRALKQLGIDVKDYASGQEILAAVTGKVSGTADAYNESLAGGLERLQIQFQNIKETLGEAFLQPLSTIIGRFSSFIEKLQESHPQLLKTIAFFTMLVTGASLILGPLLMLVGFLPAIGAGFAMISTAILPVIAIIAAVSFAVFILYQAWTNNWGGIQQKAKVVFDWLSEKFNELKAFLSVAIPIAMAVLISMWNTFANFMNTIILPIVYAVWEALSQFWKEIQPKVQAAMDAQQKRFQEFVIFLQTIFGPMIKAVGDFIKNHWLEISLFFTILWLEIRTIFQIAWEAIKAMVKIYLDVISGNWKGVWQDLVDFIINIWNIINDVTGGQLERWHNAIVGVLDRVKQAFMNLKNGIMDILHMIQFPHVNISGQEVTVFGKKIQAPKIDVAWYEQGGWVNNTGLAMVHAGEFVMSKEMLAGRQSIPNTVANNYSQPITINAVISDNADITQLGYRLAWIMRNSR